MPDLFDDGEPNVDDFALPGDEEFLTQPEATETVQEAPAEADTATEETPQPDTTEPQAEAPEDRPRNPDGTFAKKEETPAETEERLLAGKYKTTDDLERAYQEAQSKLGELGNELGQYRQWYQQQTQAQTPQIDGDSLQEQLYENPAAIIPTIQQAHQRALQGDAQAAFVRDTAVAVLREQNAVEGERFSRAIAQSEWEAAQTARQYAQSQHDSQWNNTAESLAQELPRLDEFAPQMLQLAQEQPAALAALQTGSPDAKAFVLRTLYRDVEARQGRQNADTLATTAHEIARRSAEDAERAVREASVASTTTVVPTRQLSPREKDLAETFAAWDAEEKRYSDGWNIG